MRSSISHLGRAFLLSIAMFAGTHHAAAEPITYQGRLTDASMPATGSYDMIFRVYSAATGGDLLATAPTVTVSALDGLIVATPDFPVGTFTGATVYLDISLRHSGATLYTRLGQRQAVTPAPLSMRSLNERWSPLSATRVRTDEGVTGVLINDVATTFGDTALMVTSATPAGSLGGMYVNTPVADGVPYYGWSASRAMLAEARVDGATNTFLLRNASLEWLRINSEGRVGIGTTPTASERLRVNGNIVALGQVVADDVVAGDDVIATDTSFANTFAYSTPETRSTSFGPEAFHAANGSDGGRFGGASGYAFLDSSVVSGAMTTGVHLPQGAVVIGLDAYLVDNSAAANLIISIDRRAYTGTGYTTMASVSSSGAVASIVTLSTTTVTSPMIDNVTYCYSVWVYSDDWQGISMYVKGVRIRYTVPGPD